MNFYELFILISSGLGIGFLSITYGVAGGLIALPTLYLLYPQLPAHTVIGSCLVMVFIISATSTFKTFKKDKNISLKTLGPLAAFQSFGCVIGAKVALKLPSSILKTSIGILIPTVLLCLACKRVKKRSQNDVDHNFIFKSFFKNSRVCLGIFVAGIIAGLTGLGGGIFLIPILISVLKIPRTNISKYSNPIMMLGSFFGMIIFVLAEAPAYVPKGIFPFQVGQTNLALFASISFGASIILSFSPKRNIEMPNIV